MRFRKICFGKKHEVIRCIVQKILIYQKREILSYSVMHHVYVMGAILNQQHSVQTNFFIAGWGYSPTDGKFIVCVLESEGMN